MKRNQGVVVVLDEKTLITAQYATGDGNDAACDGCGDNSMAVSAPQGDGVLVPSFLLLGKLKATINEVVTALQAPSNSYDVDSFIAVVEECLRELKTVKVERRIELRRANMTLKGATAASPFARDTSSPINKDGADDGGTVEHPSTPKGSLTQRSYKAALLKQKKASPKRLLVPASSVPGSASKVDTGARDHVEESRRTSALRAEERQRQAEERRLGHLQGIKMRGEAADARTQRAKARREEAHHRTVTDTRDKQEGGVRRAEEARQQTRERAQRAHSRVEEVRLTNELRHQTKAILIDKKMSDAEYNQEQLREERQKAAAERQEAVLAAAERRRNLSQERAERRQQREQQRQESLRRVEEQKRVELEVKQQRAEVWEKKVHQHHKDTTAEAEALTRKTEEKLQQSERFREEQREKLQQRRMALEQKQREARERRVREGSETKPSLWQWLPPLSVAEEEQASQRVTKLAATAARQGAAFADNYQKECLSSTRDLNRSKLRAAFSRLSAAVSSTSLSQCRQPLHDITSCAMAEDDHQFVRYFNMFDIIVRLIGEVRRAQEHSTVRQAAEWLQSLFTDPVEGKEHVVYFVRSGNIVPLAITTREEARSQRQGDSGVLCCLLSIIGVCLERICNEASGAVKLAAVRDQVLSDMEAVGLERVCLAVITACASDSDLELTYGALCIINAQLTVFTRRKGDVRFPWFQHVAIALFTLLQNTLTPEGVPLQEGARQLSYARVTILFSVFRTLNMLARWQLASLQELLHDAGGGSGSNNSTFPVATLSSSVSGATPGTALPSREDAATNGALTSNQLSRMELFHVLNGFFMYINGHNDDLEAIPVSSVIDESTEGASNSSFTDALRFGVTLAGLPIFPYARGGGNEPNCVPALGNDYHLRAALHECILLVGYLCLDDHTLQEMLSWGKDKTLLGNMLSVLPIQYFTNARHIFFPTVLAAVCHSARNMRIVHDEMELGQLNAFIKDEYESLSKKAKAYAQEHYKELNAFRLANDPRHFLIQSTRGKSWAEMNDDDMMQPPTPRSIHSMSSTPAIEKDRLCKGLRVTGLSAVNLFRIERRLPIAYWPGVMEELDNMLKTKK